MNSNFKVRTISYIISNIINISTFVFGLALFVNTEKDKIYPDWEVWIIVRLVLCILQILISGLVYDTLRNEMKKIRLGLQTVVNDSSFKYLNPASHVLFLLEILIVIWGCYIYFRKSFTEDIFNSNLFVWFSIVVWCYIILYTIVFAIFIFYLLFYLWNTCYGCINRNGYSIINAPSP